MFGRAPFQIMLATLIVASLSTSAHAQSNDNGVCSTIAVPGALHTSATGINNAGVVVGNYITNGGGGQHGYIFSNGQFTTLTAPDSLWTAAVGINDAGVVVGSYGPATPVCNCVDDIEAHGFIYSNGAFTTFDVGLSQTRPLGINSAGIIVGYYHDRDGDIEDAPRGFLLSAGGGLTRIDAPGGGPLTEIRTYVRGINDNGVAVGSWGGPGVGGGFTWQNGAMTMLRHPEGQESTELSGISNDGTIVGTYFPSGAIEQASFTFASNRFSEFDCFEPTAEAPPPAPDPDLPAFGPSLGASPQPSGSGPTMVSALNNRGAMVGNRIVNGVGQGFVTKPVTFADPVPALIPQGTTRITTANETLASEGRIVQGIAADGVTQVVVKIPAASQGQSITVTLVKNESTGIGGDTDKYGGLGVPGAVCPGPDCAHENITVNAVNTTAQGPVAFVVYRAPKDFSMSSMDPEAGLAVRDVYFRIETSGAPPKLVPLRVVRPPVALVHGIWDDPTLWNNFAPLSTATGGDSRFVLFRLNYGFSIGPSITSTTPVYPASIVTEAKASALGFEFNARIAFNQTRSLMQDFKGGRNPAGIAVAAVQVDAVAHSMGGNVVRTMPMLAGFFEHTYGKGIIHSLTTISTPHRGTRMATEMLAQMAQGPTCFALQLAGRGNIPLNTVTLRGAGVVSGGTRDFVHAPLSQALNRMTNNSPIGLRIATLAAVYQNFGVLDSLFNIRLNELRRRCPQDPMVQEMTESRWPQLVGTPSDGVVPVSSQDPNSQEQHFEGYVHSTGMVSLGFSGPTIISNGPVALYVIGLLNISKANTDFFECFPSSMCSQ
jgi:uncharacterized membrane protein